MASTSYLLPLTIQYVDETRAVLHFELEEPAAGYIFYRRPDEPLETAAFLSMDSEQTVHMPVLEGLSPGASYTVEIGIEGEDGLYRAPSFRGEMWGSVTLTTRSVENTQLRVGVIGDSGFGEPITFALAEHLAESDLDFVIHTGDVVNIMLEEQEDPYLAYWMKYYLPFASVLKQMPIYAVPGNHEYDPAASWEGDPFYYQAFPSHPLINKQEDGIDEYRRWYALEIGSIQFLMLDSETVFGAPGRAEMRAWMEQRLADDRFTITVPAAHIPLFTGGIYIDESMVFRQLWHHLYVQSNVPIVLSGHDHNYQRIEVDGITYLVSGGGSTTLYVIREQIEGHQYYQRVSHFIVLEFGPEAIEIQAFNREGLWIDGAETGMP